MVARRLVWEDIWFGTVAMILELIPILSFFFLLTTTAGAAIWTARLEEGRQQTVPQDPEQPDDPPPYTDHV